MKQYQTQKETETKSEVFVIIGEGSVKYLEYDGWHRTSRVRETNSTGNVIEAYFYDQNGERLKKTEYSIDASGNNRSTYYISKEFLNIRITNGTTYNEIYYYLNDKLVAMKDGSGNKVYYHSDHLGSTTLVTNQAGDVVEDDVYLPFGAIYTGLADSRYLFTGKEYVYELDRFIDNIQFIRSQKE